MSNQKEDKNYGQYAITVIHKEWYKEILLQHNSTCR